MMPLRSEKGKVAMSLDERIRDARDAIQSMPVEPPGSIQLLVRRARRRRLIGVAAALAFIAGVGVAIWSTVPDERRSIVGIDSATTTVASPGSALVTPMPFGGADLVFVPGAWGADAAVMVVDDAIEISSAGVTATVIDLGPAGTSAAEVEDPYASLDDVPRLGPLGPAADVSVSGDDTTVTAVIGQRRVQASGAGVGVEWLTTLLRSVTTAPAIAPIRAGDGTVELVDVVGLDYRDATAQLEALGVRVAWTLQQVADASYGTVLSMDPGPSTEPKEGSRVILTVSGPQNHFRPRPPFTPVAGTTEEVAGPGYIVNYTQLTPDAPEEAAQQSAQLVLPPWLPIVFLHGELVGLFSYGQHGHDLFGPSELLTNLTDPNYRYVPYVSPPTLPPPPLNQTAEFRGVSMDVPDTWVITHDSCPATETAAVGTPPADCPSEAPPGPWIALQPAPPGLTACGTGGIGTEAGGDMRTCWINNLEDGSTDAFIPLGSGVLVTTVYDTSGNGPGVVAAMIDTLRADAASGTAVYDPTAPSIEIVRAVIAGRCDLVAASIAPESKQVTPCEQGDTDAQLPSRDAFTAETAVPTVDPDDRTRDGIDVSALIDGPEAGTWHVETRSYYDATVGDAVSLITLLADPNGNTLIAPVPPPAEPTVPDTTVVSAPAPSSSLAGFTFTLPEGTIDDPRPDPSLPEFVEAYDRWLVPDRSTLIVTIQNVAPLIPSEQSRGTFQANGLTWELFDVGPSDGSTITAVTEVGAAWILVGAQGWTADQRTVPREFVDQVARSMQRPLGQPGVDD